MVAAFVKSGDYEKLTDAKYLTSDKYLKRGDILVKEGSHTLMVLENGSAVIAEASAPEAKPEPKKSVEEIAREVIRGKWGNGAERKNRLAAAGYNYTEVQAEVTRLLK